MASSEARPGSRRRAAALAAVILAACTQIEPFNPLEPPTCTVVYPHGLNGPAVCTDNPASVCASGSSFCPLGFGGYCASLSSDVFNCGACNAPCPQGGSCTAGTCSCPANQVDCNGRCVDLSADPDNCGQCGQACGEGVCSSGHCVCNTSPSTVMQCGGSPACVDITSSPTDCGGCGNACPQLNSVCNGGTCACPAERRPSAPSAIRVCAWTWTLTLSTAAPAGPRAPPTASAPAAPVRVPRAPRCAGTPAQTCPRIPTTVVSAETRARARAPPTAATSSRAVFSDRAAAPGSSATTARAAATASPACDPSRPATCPDSR